MRVDGLPSPDGVEITGQTGTPQIQGILGDGILGNVRLVCSQEPFGLLDVFVDGIKDDSLANELLVKIDVQLIRRALVRRLLVDEFSEALLGSKTGDLRLPVLANKIFGGVNHFNALFAWVGLLKGLT